MFNTFRNHAARTPEEGPSLLTDDSENEPPADGDSPELAGGIDGTGSTTPYRSPRSVARLLIPGVLPVMVLLLAVGAGYLKWQLGATRAAITASTESVRAASEGTVALLSYRADTVESDLVAAREHLTGDFLDAFTTLTDDVVIPGAKQRRIFSSASVPAAASMSATDRHAVVLVFVNQTTSVGDDPPTQTASSVKVTLDDIAGRWLISDFAPI